MKKGIYSLLALGHLLLAPNRRYLNYISALDDLRAGITKGDDLSKTVVHSDLNRFDQTDQKLLATIASGEFTFSGFQNKHLRQKLPHTTSAQISRTIKRLHVHGLIKRVGHTYKYYLTALGSQVITMALKLKELVIIPHLAGHLGFASNA